MVLGALSVGALLIWVWFAPILRRGADAASARPVCETG
jgi:Na+/proline symporter